MVQVGFICEGNTEFILLESTSFKNYLASININSVRVIDAQGSGNLLPHNIGGYIETLEKAGSEKIVLLTDLDNDVCITQTKQRIQPRLNDSAIIAAKKIESWFLADTNTMRSILADQNFTFQNPEQELDPFSTINNLLVQYRGRGIGTKSGGKIKLAHKMIANGFDINRASQHQNCASVKYFVDKLTAIGKTP